MVRDDGALVVVCSFAAGSRCMDPREGSIGPPATWTITLGADGQAKSVHVEGGPLGKEDWLYTYSPQSRPGVAIRDTFGGFRLVRAGWYETAPAWFFERDAVLAAFKDQRSEVRAISSAIALQSTRTPGAGAGGGAAPGSARGWSGPLILTGVVAVLVGAYAWWRRRA